MEKVYELMRRFETSGIHKMQLKMPGLEITMEQGDDAAAYRSVSKNMPMEEADREESQELCPVKAPLAGTFYRSPSPEAAAYVEVGDHVKKGDIIGIVEAMKMMNEITSPAEGVVTMIEAENESLVGYGQVLMYIKESSDV